jgi:hypothetical protein
MQSICHKNFKGHHWLLSGTVVAQLPVPLTVMEDFLQCKDTTIPVGIALTHKKDQYCKKTGRELAASRMSPQVFKLEKIERRFADAYTFHYVANVKLNTRVVGVRLGVSVKAGAADCRLVFAEIE